MDRGRPSQDNGQYQPDTSYDVYPEDGPDHRDDRRYINTDSIEYDDSIPHVGTNSAYDEAVEDNLPPADDVQPVQEHASTPDDAGDGNKKGFFGRKKKDKKEKKEKKEDRDSLSNSLREKSAKVKGMFKKKSKKTTEEKEADDSEQERAQPLRQYESEPESRFQKQDMDLSIDKPPLDDSLPPSPSPQPFDPSPGGYVINPSNTLNRQQSSFSTRAASLKKSVFRHSKPLQVEGVAELKPQPKKSLARCSVIITVLLAAGFVAGIIMTAAAGDSEILQVIGPIFIGLSLFALLGKIYFTLFHEPEIHPILKPISAKIDKMMEPKEFADDLYPVYPGGMYPVPQSTVVAVPNNHDDAYNTDGDTYPMTNMEHPVPVYDEPPHNMSQDYNEEDDMPPGDYRESARYRDNQGVVFDETIDTAPPRCVYSYI